MNKAMPHILSICFCVVLAGLAGSLLKADIETIDTANVAERLNNNEAVSAELVQSLAEGKEYQVALTSCRSSILKPALIIQLENLDRRFQSDDQTGKQSSLNRASGLMSHVEACNPANGDAWLRDAMVMHAVGAKPEQVLARLTLSSTLMPNYKPEVSGRIALWSVLEPATIDKMADLVDHDLSTVLFYFPVREAKAMLQELPANLQRHVSQLMVIVPEERRALLE